MKVSTKPRIAWTGFAAVSIAAMIVGVQGVVAQPPPLQITSVLGEIPDADIKVKMKEPTVISQDTLTFQPGAATPWHYHPGAAFVVVGTGAITEQDADGCIRVFPAGSAFFEAAGRVHRVSNETGGVSQIFGTLLLPAGSPPLVPVADPPPAVCGGH